ncbi:hypothetical protein D3C76_1720910 [compost metagenome]
MDVFAAASAVLLPWLLFALLFVPQPAINSVSNSPYTSGIVFFIVLAPLNSSWLTDKLFSHQIHNAVAIHNTRSWLYCP